jgi:hypothetical protein
MIPHELLECDGPPQGGFAVAHLTPLWRPALLKETFDFVDCFAHKNFGRLVDNSYEQST